MNILLILPDSLSNPMGGMGVQALGLMAAMPQHTFDVIAPDLDITGGSNYKLHPYTRQSLVVDLNTISRQVEDQTAIMSSVIRNVITEGRIPDVIHSFDWSTALAGMELAKALNRPFVYTVQLSFTSLMSEFYKHAKDVTYQQAVALEMQALTTADLVVHVSKEYLNKYGIFNPERSYYMPNGIDLSYWLSVPYEKKELPGRADSYKIGYIGRYAEMKNIEGILGATLPDNVDIYFMGGTRGGHPGYFDAMQAYVEKNDNAYYLGPVYGEEKVNTLRALDALIVPSHHEPFGIVCLEALAAQCILLSSFCGGMGEFLSPETAINCGTSPETISSAIEKAVGMSFEEVVEQREQGLRLCQEYSWNRAGQYMSVYYQKAIENHSLKKELV